MSYARFRARDVLDASIKTHERLTASAHTDTALADDLDRLDELKALARLVLRSAQPWDGTIRLSASDAYLIEDAMVF